MSPAAPFVRRISLRNYKSIGQCDVEVGRLTLVVGRNGAGKSNFLDSLRFIVDSLESSLDHALRSRGGLDGVRRKSTGHPHNFTIGVELELEETVAHYGFEIASRGKGGFAVKEERLVIRDTHDQVIAQYKVRGGELESSTPAREVMPPVPPDRLYLVTAAARPEFRAVYESLRAMGFYNLNPERIRALQSPDAGELLRRDGSNLASVIARLSEDRPAAVERMEEYLRTITKDVVGFSRIQLANSETIEFRQEVKGSAHPWKFFASNMSDGTLRALAVLVAVMQLADRENPVRLVGIEEPETALHPASSKALMDALREAAETTQIIVTTHSPDLLDDYDPAIDDLIVVQSTQGLSELGRADRASQKSIREHLCTAGELLRLDQLQPDAEDVVRQPSFGFEGDQ